MIPIDEALTLLRHFDPFMRERGKEALRAHGQAAVPALIRSLEHPEEIVRGQAALLLGESGDNDAVRPIARRIIDLKPGEERAFHLRALVDLTTPALRHEDWLVELFARFTKDSDLFMRALACKGLGRLGDRRGLRFLERAQADREDWVREAASNAIIELYQAPPFDPPAVADEAPESPSPPEPDSDRASESDADPDGSQAAASEADGDETAQPREIDPDHLREALEDLFGRDAVRRDFAAEALESWGSPAALPLLQAVARAPDDASSQALVLLSRLAQPGWGPQLLEIARRATAEDPRTIAIRTLGRVCEGTEKEILDYLLGLNSKSELLRAAKATALGAFRSIRAGSALLTLLDDASPIVREAAAAALTRIVSAAPDELGVRLLKRLRAEKDETVRSHLLEAVDAAVAHDRIAAPQASELGLDLLKKGTASSKVAGLRLLAAARRRTTDVAKAVARALKDSERSVRLLAAELAPALSPNGFAPVVEQLRRLVADADRDLSRQAILSLGSVGGPDAAAMLRQLRADADTEIAEAARAALERLPAEGAEVILLRPDRD